MQKYCEQIITNRWVYTESNRIKLGEILRDWLDLGTAKGFTRS